MMGQRAQSFSAYQSSLREKAEQIFFWLCKNPFHLITGHGLSASRDDECYRCVVFIQFICFSLLKHVELGKGVGSISLVFILKFTTDLGMRSGKMLI